MADDKRGRNKQARDTERRQQERDIVAELERGAEPEPPVDAPELEDLEEDLDALDFPATGAEVITAVGTHETDPGERTYTMEELVPDTDAETFDSPAALRVRVRRPTVAAAMKRVLEATKTLPHAELSDSQRDAYERTFKELKAIDAADDDEGIRTISDWIVERIHDEGRSRGLRRYAGTQPRSAGRTDIKSETTSGSVCDATSSR